MRRDSLFFGLPAVVVLTVGLIFCARDGLYDGIVFSVAEIAGLTLLVAGLTIMLIGQATLKRSYSGTLVVRRDHKLVTHGIYRFTRHPIYLGAIMGLCIGIPLFAPSLYGFLILLALIPIALNRIRMEEAMLTEEYGEAYRSYRERTSKLIPLIY
jgi:protein-S-isoprenylcysteine O-methyltransferase Ste14